MGEHQSSLKAEGERLLPPWKRPRGNYDDSEIWAALCELSGSDVVVSAHTAGYYVGILLFMHDYPITSRGHSFYTVFDAPSALNYDDYIEFLDSLGNLTGNLIITADDESIDLYEQATGPTLTNAVQVEGYYVYGVILDRGLTLAAAAVDPTYKVRATSEAASVEGAPHFQGAGNADYTPIILLETDYTQAMHDANNVYTVGTLRYEIVGLWNTESPA